MTILQSIHRSVHFVMLLVMVTLAGATAAHAATNPAPIDPSVCTTMSQRADALFRSPAPQANEPPGILTEIFNFIKDVTTDATENIFSTFIENSSYQYAITAVLTLYIVIFGVMFIMGLVQATFGQVLIRLIKIGIILALTQPSGWFFFYDYVVRFFNDGTDELIAAVMNIAAGVPANAGAGFGASPFYRIDRIASFLIHPETLTAIMGSATSGVYSFGMTGLMLLAFFGFVKLLVSALQTYAVAFVVRSLLLGLAPIFFVFLLFERTKGLFTGWLNLLVGFSLNPILLFTFLSFMVVMIQSATVNMMSVELCWTTTAIGEGADKQRQFWRFLDENGEPYLLEWTFEGNRQCTIVSGSSAGQQCPQFPIKIIDVLTFFLLVWLAMRFAEVIDRISNELASTVASLSADTKLMHYLSKDEGAAQAPPTSSNTQAMGARNADQQTQRSGAPGG